MAMRGSRPGGVGELKAKAAQELGSGESHDALIDRRRGASVRSRIACQRMFAWKCVIMLKENIFPAEFVRSCG
jgi:hypothetical protein